MKKIDTHHHIIPSCYLENMAKVGVTTLNGIKGAPFPDWSPEKMLNMMDRFDIQAAIVSAPEPPPQQLDEAYNTYFARSFNDYSASLIKDYPSRIVIEIF